MNLTYKSVGFELSGISSVIEGGEKDEQVEHRGHLGQRNCSVRYCNGAYVTLCIGRSP